MSKSSKKDSSKKVAEKVAEKAEPKSTLGNTKAGSDSDRMNQAIVESMKKGEKIDPEIIAKSTDLTEKRVENHIQWLISKNRLDKSVLIKS